MSDAALMAPVFVLVALTFLVTFKMGRVRARAVSSGETRIRQIALGESAWSDNVKKVSNNYANLLQLPMLFYAAAAFYIVLAKVDVVAVTLAWVFVATRFGHSFVHTGSNRVSRRFMIFAGGVFVLIALWVWLALRVFLLG